MGRKRKRVKRFVRYKKAGWYWNGYKIGAFCHLCGQPLYLRRGVHPRYVCFDCQWEEGVK